MSAIFGRIILTVGLGLVSAVILTLWNKNRNEPHGHQGPNSRRRPDDFGGADNWDGVPSSWRDSAYDDSDNDREEEEEKKRRRLRKRKEKEAEANKSETTTEGTSAKEDDSSNPSSIQTRCFICLDTFKELKRKGIPIWCTPCGHLFCRPCLERAVRMSPHCPSCRVRVNFSNCHKIHL